MDVIFSHFISIFRICPRGINKNTAVHCQVGDDPQNSPHWDSKILRAAPAKHVFLGWKGGIGTKGTLILFKNKLARCAAGLYSFLELCWRCIQKIKMDKKKWPFATWQTSFLPAVYACCMAPRHNSDVRCTCYHCDVPETKDKALKKLCIRNRSERSVFGKSRERSDGKSCFSPESCHESRYDFHYSLQNRPSRPLESSGPQSKPMMSAQEVVLSITASS